MTEQDRIPNLAQQSVLTKSDLNELDEFNQKRKVIKGYDFNDGLNYEQLFDSYSTTGFQATNLGEAIRLVNQMLDCRFNCKFENDDLEHDAFIRRRSGCTIFLSYTSNLISSGKCSSLHTRNH